MRSLKDRSREIGRFLARARKAAGMTQQDIALAVGITAQQISKYERGESDITVVMHEAVMAAIKGDGRPAGLQEGAAAYAAPSELQLECLQILELLPGIATQLDAVEARTRELAAKLSVQTF